MADLQAMIARVKDALVTPRDASNHSAPAAEVAPTLDVDGHRAEMASRFARELEAVRRPGDRTDRPEGLTIA